MIEQKKWYAVYSKPRSEKKLSNLFTEKKIENYCPVTKAKKQWSDRVRWVEEPLFKSYVFVFIRMSEFNEIRRMKGVVNFVYWLGKPAIIKQYEIDRIKRFLNDYPSVITESLAIKEQDEVIITGGALMDKKARVVKVKGKHLELEIESIGFRLVAQIESKNVRRF